MRSTGTLSFVLAVSSSCLLSSRLFAQPASIYTGAPSGPKFEVASVKLADREEAMRLGYIGVKRDPSRVDISNWSLKQLTMRAYGLWPTQISGPNWMDSLRFDVSAKIPAAAKPDDFPGMLQWLLLERFGLKAHTEMKNVASFALVVAKGGPKMKPAQPDAGAVESNLGSNRVERVGRALERLWGSGTELGLRSLSAEGGNARLEFTRMPMDALAQLLSSYLRAPVIDRTGLEGNYEATLEFSLADTLAMAQAAIASGDGPTASDNFGTSLFSTVQRLGLKLESRKASIPVLVIDHLERAPTAN